MPGGYGDRVKWGAAFVWVVLALITTAMPGCGAGDTSAVRASVATGLVAGHDGLTSEQVRTFTSDVRGGWAAVYDPGDPLGCTPGGLWGAPLGPALPEAPCTAWVLQRQKSRWVIHSHGLIGDFDAPDGSPKDLGDPARLVYLASGD